MKRKPKKVTPMQETLEKMMEVQEELRQGFERLRIKYESLDDRNKKKIIAGMVSLASILAAAGIAKRTQHRRGY